MLQCDLLTLATYGLPFTPVNNEIEFIFTLYPARTEFKQVRPSWKEYRRGRKYDDDPRGGPARYLAYEQLGAFRRSLSGATFLW